MRLTLKFLLVLACLVRASAAEFSPGDSSQAAADGLRYDREERRLLAALAKAEPAARTRLEQSLADLRRERGQELARRFRYADAAPLLAQAAEWNQVHRPERIPADAVQLARLDLALGKADEARRWAAAAQQAAAAQGDRDSEAMAMACEGMAWRLASNRTNALRMLQAAVERGRSAHAAAAEAAGLLGLAGLALEEARAADATTLFAQARQRAEDAADPELVSNAWSGIGAAQAFQHHFGEATNAYARAVETARQARNEDAEAEGLAELGSYLAERGEFAAARARMADALAARRRLGDRFGEGIALANLADVEASLGQFAAATNHFAQSLTIAAELNDFSGAVARHNNLGKLFQVLGRLDQASEQYEAAARLQGDHGVPRPYLTLNNKAAVLVLRGNLAAGMELFTNALTLARAARDAEAEANTLNNLGVAFRKAGRIAEAIDAHRAAAAAAERLQHPALQAAAFNDLGAAERALGRLRLAAEALDQALVLARDAGETALEAAAWNNLMIVHRLGGERRLAILAGKEAVNRYQGMRRELAAWDHQTRQEFVASRQNAYRVLAELLIEDNRLPEAMRVLGFLKEEELLEYVRENTAPGGAVARSGAETGAADQWSRVMDEVIALARERRSLLGIDRDLTPLETERLRLLKRQLQQAQERLAGIQDEIRRTLAARSFQVQEVSPSAVESLPNQLGPGHVVLYTLAAEKTLYTIIVTPDLQVPVTNAISLLDLSDKVIRLRHALQNQWEDPVELAQEVYRMVVKPLEKHLAAAQASTLVWSLDGPLRILPMPALHDGTNYLVERFRQTTLTVASPSQVARTPSGDWSIMALGVSKECPGFVPLPGVSNELFSIVRPSANDRRRVFLNDDFTVEALERAFRLAPVIHIASHFQIEPDAAGGAFLLLGQERLPMAEFDKWPASDFARVELVTLSACNTATAGTETNNIEGFAGIVQRKGAPAVIGTLWPVADASTPVLMREFYGRLVAGGTIAKVEALRQAQAALLHGRHEGQTMTVAMRGTRPLSASTPKVRFKPDPQRPFAHPYFWAPFVLVGNPR